MAVASTTALKGASSYRGFAGIPADTASYFTTDGSGVAISAPGEDEEHVSRAGAITSVGILSTMLGGGTTRMSGTSMASPHVAGVAALIYASMTTAPDGSTPDDVRSKIASTSLGFGTVPLASPNSCYTFDGVPEGVVSAAAAVVQ
jgi:subtilisin family serine protease